MARGTFRDGSYYRHVKFGKRTVKQGECAAIWDMSGRRKLIEGPQRVRLWWSHVRFLSRATADGHEYLVIKYRDGRKEHRRGPCAIFIDPCIHETVNTRQAYKLSANEALITYREGTATDEPSSEQPRHGEVVRVQLANGKHPENDQQTVAAASAVTTAVTTAIGKPAGVLRQIVRGPAVYVPNHDTWVHTFDWHGSPRADAPGRGSKTGTQNDTKVPHALQFQTLRCMPDQMYVTIRDMRTKDDAQLAVHLMLFYELVDIERMLDATNDPIGDFINAASADVICFGASNTYESLLEKTELLSDLNSFPIIKERMASVGYKLHKVVYRGYSTSHKLQEMHDDAIAKRTALRLQSATARVEQAEQAMLLNAKEERSQGEQALDSASAKHRLELLRLEAEQKREEADADHAQALRHEEERATAKLKVLTATHDEEIRRVSALKGLGVDLTKLLCTVGDRAPDQHIRIDSATPTALHLNALS